MNSAHHDREFLPCVAEVFLDLGNARLVAFVKRPLLDAPAPDETGLNEHAQVLAGGRLADAELLRDEQATDAVLDEIALDLRREVGARRLQPPHGLEAAVRGPPLCDARRPPFRRR